MHAARIMCAYLVVSMEESLFYYFLPFCILQHSSPFCVHSISLLVDQHLSFLTSALLTFESDNAMLWRGAMCIGGYLATYLVSILWVEGCQYPAAQPPCCDSGLRRSVLQETLTFRDVFVGCRRSGSSWTLLRNLHRVVMLENYSHPGLCWWGTLHRVAGTHPLVFPSMGCCSSGCLGPEWVRPQAPGQEFLMAFVPCPGWSCSCLLCGWSALRAHWLGSQGSHQKQTIPCPAGMGLGSEVCRCS